VKWQDNSWNNTVWDELRVGIFIHKRFHKTLIEKMHKQFFEPNF